LANHKDANCESSYSILARYALGWGLGRDFFNILCPPYPSKVLSAYFWRSDFSPSPSTYSPVPST
ncbi:hypothetical protein, partial [Nostoc sp. 'Peltigera membranacea cyanobiont' 213]|uniref:hypothetical protein n=1 Tax=Nostoc sp. 'Peltigera membranacea cyanobiont' 213 TaxID=2014530 RepID=UPI001CB8F489